jgi:hypothetical protein
MKIIILREEKQEKIKMKRIRMTSIFFEHAYDLMDVTE